MSADSNENPEVCIYAKKKKVESYLPAKSQKHSLYSFILFFWMVTVQPYNFLRMKRERTVT